MEIPYESDSSSQAIPIPIFCFAATLGIAVGLAKIGLMAWHANVAIYSVLAVGVIYMVASMTSLRRMNYLLNMDAR